MVVTAVNHAVRFSNRVVNHDDYVIWVSFDAELKDKSIGIGVSQGLNFHLNQLLLEKKSKKKFGERAFTTRWITSVFIYRVEFIFMLDKLSTITLYRTGSVRDCLVSQRLWNSKAWEVCIDTKCRILSSLQSTLYNVVQRMLYAVCSIEVKVPIELTF